MCYVDERTLGVIEHITVNNRLNQIAVAQIQTVQGLVENQQIGTLYKGTCQQYQTLLATRHLKELAVGQVLNKQKNMTLEDMALMVQAISI